MENNGEVILIDEKKKIKNERISEESDVSRREEKEKAAKKY